MLRGWTYFWNGIFILVAGVSLLMVEGLTLNLGLVIGLCAGVLNIVLIAKPSVELFYCRLGMGMNVLAVIVGAAIALHGLLLLTGILTPPADANALGLLLILFAAVCLVATVLALIVYGRDIRAEQVGEKPRI